MKTEERRWDAYDCILRNLFVTMELYQSSPYEWLEQGAKYCYFPKYDMKFAEFVFDNRLNYMNQNIHDYKQR